LHEEYPSVYQLLRMFYRQDPISRVELLHERSR
jgi:Mlc titration factor MtfA (ptsG expression regulator)